MDQLMASWGPRILSLVRIVSAFLFIQHGTQKIFGFPAAARSEFVLASMSGVAGVLEMVGGALLLIGLFTRPVAFVLSGLMAFAYFIAHAPRNFWPLNNGGELAVLFCFVFLYLAFAGGGPWGVDKLRTGRA